MRVRLLQEGVGLTLEVCIQLATAAVGNSSFACKGERARQSSFMQGGSNLKYYSPLSDSDRRRLLGQ